MSKPGISIQIPGFGTLDIQTIVSDYTGTLSCGGKLVPGVAKRLRMLLHLVDIHVVTSDSYGTVRDQLKGILEPQILVEGKHDLQKQEFVKRFDTRRVAAFGNGNNDRLLLSAVKGAGGLAVAVDNGEGCALDALQAANLFIVGAERAFDLLLERTSLKATLRF
jgi:soluble P-type ATPase